MDGYKRGEGKGGGAEVALIGSPGPKVELDFRARQRRNLLKLPRIKQKDNNKDMARERGRER